MGIVLRTVKTNAKAEIDRERQALRREMLLEALKAVTGTKQGDKSTPDDDGTA
jgi:hypothetical protein